MISFYKEHQDDLRDFAIDHYIDDFRSIYNEHGRDVLIASLHENVSEMLQRAGLWEKASCNKSCSFCCHDTIYMTQLESEYIANRIKEEGILPHFDRMIKQQEGNPTFMEKACPMLSDVNEEGNRPCSIYEFRPLVCRTHNSIEDPKFCDRDKYPGRFNQEGRAIATEAIYIALVMLEQELSDKFDDVNMVPMHNLNFD